MNARDAELLRAKARAANTVRATDRSGPAEAAPTAGALFSLGATSEGEARPQGRIALGTKMSEMMRHGGVYTLADATMMKSRFDGMLFGMAAQGMTEEEMKPILQAMDMAASVPGFFFYHLVDKPYKLHSQLVSYLTHPARHLGSPIPPPPSSAPHPLPPASAVSPPSGPIADPGCTYDQVNVPTAHIPAAATFIGQFIDHDLTLNAVNLFLPQTGTVRDQASPFIDLDSVYGPRIDDEMKADRETSFDTASGMFRLIPVCRDDDVVGYDVCREYDRMNRTQRALIGDKRNDENQLILQVHILAMRLHNHFFSKAAGATVGDRSAAARRQTVLHWQAMVATYYLPLVARSDAIAAVLKRLLAAPDPTCTTTPEPEPEETLCHRPGLTPAGGCTLGMPHEFAIGFRFGHSQLRSEYRLVAEVGRAPIRLFDPLAVRPFQSGVPVDEQTVSPEHDLQGGKPLTWDHLIEWKYFADTPSDRSHFSQAPSNLIDTKVTEDVFALPESTIPDDIRLVNNLPARNLIRSDNVGLCAGEDLACLYARHYPDLATVAPMPLAPGAVETARQDLFKLGSETNGCKEPGDIFRTPLWYYLLREAEAARLSEPGKPEGPKPVDGRLGMLGSLLVAEVLLSGIRYAPTSLFGARQPADDRDWRAALEQWTDTDVPLVSFLDLVALVEQSDITPTPCQTKCSPCGPTPGGEPSSA